MSGTVTSEALADMTDRLVDFVSELDLDAIPPRDAAALIEVLDEIGREAARAQMILERVWEKATPLGSPRLGTASAMTMARGLARASTPAR